MWWYIILFIIIIVIILFILFKKDVLSFRGGALGYYMPQIYSSYPIDTMIISVNRDYLISAEITYKDGYKVETGYGTEIHIPPDVTFRLSLKTKSGNIFTGNDLKYSDLKARHSKRIVNFRNRRYNPIRRRTRRRRSY